MGSGKRSMRWRYERMAKAKEEGMFDAEMNMEMDEQARLVFNFYPPQLDILGGRLAGWVKRYN